MIRSTLAWAVIIIIEHLNAEVWRVSASDVMPIECDVVPVGRRRSVALSAAVVRTSSKHRPRALIVFLVCQAARIYLPHIARHERLSEESEEQGQRSGRQPQATIAPGQVINVCISSCIRSIHSHSRPKLAADPGIAAGCDCSHLAASTEWQLDTDTWT